MGTGMMMFEVEQDYQRRLRAEREKKANGEEIVTTTEQSTSVTTVSETVGPDDTEATTRDDVS